MPFQLQYSNNYYCRGAEHLKWLCQIQLLIVDNQILCNPKLRIYTDGRIHVYNSLTYGIRFSVQTDSNLIKFMRNNYRINYS